MSPPAPAAAAPDLDVAPTARPAASAAPDAAVRVEGVSKRFRRTTALDAVSFDVPAGSVFGLLGPNGAGKTTLFSIMANFLFADAGRVEVLGVDTRRPSALRGRLTILPQDASFERNVPIVDQLVFFRRLAGADAATARREAREALERVGLGEQVRRTVRTLSHGMVKRLGVAQAFLGAPEVILLDEPTSGLDPANARQVRDLVRSLHGRATVVISSHNLAEIEEMCDHVAILDRGRVVTAGSVAELTEASREFELEFRRPPGPEVAARLAALPWAGEVVAAGPATLRITMRPDGATGAGGADGPEAAMGRVMADLLAAEIVPRAIREGASLERLFLEVTRGAGGGGETAAK